MKRPARNGLLHGTLAGMQEPHDDTDGDDGAEDGDSGEFHLEVRHISPPTF